MDPTRLGLSHHDSILAVLKFFGIPELWLDFFKKLLRAKLRFDGIMEQQTRLRGVPIAHSLLVGICLISQT
jgi:hypothetical protein